MMQLPRYVMICGKRFTVKQDKSHDGGSFDEAASTIVIGTLDPEEVPENFIHEVGEAILAIRDFRFVPQKEELENGDYRFFLDHKDWQLFAKDLAAALKGVSFTSRKK